MAAALAADAVIPVDAVDLAVVPAAGSDHPSSVLLLWKRQRIPGKQRLWM